MMKSAFHPASCRCRDCRRPRSLAINIHTERRAMRILARAVLVLIAAGSAVLFWLAEGNF